MKAKVFFFGMGNPNLEDQVNSWLLRGGIKIVSTSMSSTIFIVIYDEPIN